MAYTVSAHTVRQRIRALRLERKLTQEALAAGSGVSLKHYQDLESGRKPFNPTLETLNGIAATLEVDVHTLLEPST